MSNKLSWESTKVLDWKNYVIPARPSPSELARVEEYIKRVKKKNRHIRVAILGSTVEFRSLCHRYGLDVTLIEFSRRHYEILSRQPMKYRGKEVLREEDWRTLSTIERYDLILGDLILNVVRKKDIPVILRKLRDSLEKDGLCILRTWVRANNKRLSLDAILKAYRRAGSKLHFYTANIMPLYMCCYDFKNDVGDYPAMIRLLTTSFRDGGISKAEYHSCIDRWRHEGSVFTIPLKSGVEKTMTNFFKIIKIRYGTDSFRKWGPLYVLQRKGA